MIDVRSHLFGRDPRIVLGACIFTILNVALAQAEVLRYNCILAGLQETPLVVSAGLGAGSFIIDTDANTVTYRIAYAGLNSAESAAHIHGFSDPGTPSGVVHTLPAGMPKVGVWNYTEDQEADILAGRTYVNIHTTTSPGGEIRGQITAMNAYLDGAQESPPVATPATGFATFNIDTDANTLSYYIFYDGLLDAESAAHIHGNSLHTISSGVAHPLPAGNPKVGTWNYTDADEPAILAGRTYVNIHSASFPGGEIRGQISSVVVPIDGEQETPPVSTEGAGYGVFAIDVDANELSYDIRFTGLNSAETQAHIHGFAPPGGSAGVVHALPTGSPKLGIWAYTDDQETDIVDGLTYVNIHSSSSPGGEIRGQIEGLPAPEPVSVGDVLTPRPFSMAPSFPNPFRAGTIVRYRLDAAAEVSLTVHDVTGRLVRTLAAETAARAGEHEVVWDGRSDSNKLVPAGTYYYRLTTPGGAASQSISVLR
jgi:hypothetical protein